MEQVVCVVYISKFVKVDVFETNTERCKPLTREVRLASCGGGTTKNVALDPSVSAALHVHTCTAHV